MTRPLAPIPAILCLLLSAAPAAAAQPGAVAFNRCKICHSFAAGAPNRVGPNLHGVFGRTAGTVPGFDYSPAMKKSGIVWNAATLGKFLRDPRGFIPGSRMSFPGIKDDKTLAALIAYLKQVTQ